LHSEVESAFAVAARFERFRIVSDEADRRVRNCNSIP
jgi:hypothetical protein